MKEKFMTNRGDSSVMSNTSIITLRVARFRLMGWDCLDIFIIIYQHFAICLSFISRFQCLYRSLLNIFTLANPSKNRVWKTKIDLTYENIYHEDIKLYKKEHWQHQFNGESFVWLISGIVQYCEGESFLLPNVHQMKLFLWRVPNMEEWTLGSVSG